jgi:hypothetical protein
MPDSASTSETKPTKKQDGRPWTQRLSLLVDVVMLVLIISNLALIVFDWGFESPIVQDFFQQYTPRFYTFYDGTIHQNFFFVDLIFVSVFVVEIIIRWGMAIYKQTYHRWFFYPFVHWYDLLGCVPLAGFRFLRLLRVVTIVYRLHRTGIVDLSDTAAARLLSKYYGILVEEVSDRVVIRMISDVQDEVKRGGPLLDQIVEEVLQPRKPDLVEWMSQRVQSVAAANYARYRDDIGRYVQRQVKQALAENGEFAMLSSVPIAGGIIRTRVERGITQMIESVMNGVAGDLASERNKAVVDEAMDVALEAALLKGGDEELNRIVTGTVDRALEVVKRHVAVQQWKLHDLAEDEEDFRRRMSEALREG